MTIDATITCPNCQAEIKLTESLAAPLIDPRLIPDFILLAGSKLSPQGATEPPVAT